jgi:nitrogen regulatory protein PII
MRFRLIMAIVKPQLTDKVVDSAKEAGATGATIVPARGTGMREAKSFFGLSIEDQTDILIFLVEEHVVDNILNAIRAEGGFQEPGTGIAFVLSVEQVVGLESQMKIFKDQARDQYF